MPLEDPLEEARRVLGEAKNKSVTLKLIGGIAVRLSCPSSTKPGLARKYVDIDLVGLSKQSSAIKKLFGGLGYIPRDKFNAMYGDRRLIFNDPEHERRVDVFLDVFQMCHNLELKDRLRLDGLAIPPADLLATKLQIVEINQKDYKDIFAILLDHEVGSSDGDTINGQYLAKLCGGDWGIYKTLTINLGKLAGAMASIDVAEGRPVVEERIGKLSKMIEDEPKSLKWKLRARVGERTPWYNLPEADKEVIDSRMPGPERPKAG